MKYIPILCLLFAVIHKCKSDSGCPYPDEIKPCVCTNSPTTYLLCQNIDNAEELRQVFINSVSYSYEEVHIEYSSFQFLPHDLFETAPTRKLYLKNVTLIQLFDSPPVALEDLDTLQIENTKVNRGIIWDILTPLKSLRILTIYYNSIRKLGKDFSSSATKNLQQISFYQTETRKIEPDTFAEFDKITKVACDSGELTELTRNMFSSPFLGSVLYFNDNKISTIPDDMFAQMPNLQTLGLRNNQLATFQESAMVGSGSKLDYLFLEGNPLKCDCRLAWLIEKNVPDLRGSCSTPKELYGKELKDLTKGDLHC